MSIKVKGIGFFKLYQGLRYVRKVMPFFFEAAKLTRATHAQFPKITKAGNTDTIMAIKYELLSAFSRCAVAREKHNE